MDMTVAVESSEAVEKYLHLHALTLDELQSQCKLEGHIVTDDKSSLINMIMKGKHVSKVSHGLLPQAIPLRSRDRQGKEIPGTAKNYREWRKMIFKVSSLDYFLLLDKNSKEYSGKAWNIRSDSATAKYIIDNKWYSAYEIQEELIQGIKENSNRFDYHIIQRNAGNGNNFLMLHCQLKENQNAIS